MTTNLALTAAVALLCAQVPTAQTAAVRHVAVWGGFTLVVKGDGSVVGWGREEDGLAGKPRSQNGLVAAPLAIELPGKARQVAIGELTAYALLEDGSVVAWGSNVDGQLGNGPAGANGELGRYPKPSVTPVRVTGLSDVTQIEAGAKHALALRNDGTVWAWGTRDDGRLGDGQPKTLRPVSALAPVEVPGLDGITQVAAGTSFNLALRRDGQVMAWGTNNYGELGNGTRATAWTPTPVTGLDHVVAIAASKGGGTFVSGAVKDDGTMWVWGSNSSGMMGNGQGAIAPDDPGGRNLTPIQVKGLAGVKALALGMGHAAALLGDGTLRMWGHDGWGQIGVGTWSGYYEKPTRVTALTNVAAVYLGGPHSFAVRADGTLWMWGFNFSGQGVFGKDQHVPTKIDLQ
jgi:alpha-tubulin suppressor-like RCC1 family protein